MRFPQKTKVTTSTTSYRHTKAVVAFVLAFALGFLYVAPKAFPEEPAPEQDAILTQHTETLKYRKGAAYWAKKRGKSLPAATAQISPEKTLSAEEAKTRTWKTRRDKHYRAFKRTARALGKHLRACSRFGAPRKVCKALVEATKKAPVPLTWASDPSLLWLIKHESGFRPCVRNGGLIDCAYRGDSAWGLFQFLGSTWKGTGVSQTSDARLQAVAGFRYIKNRYRTPARAKAFWLANHWY